ncbi:MAG: FAD-binding domain-containing protein [Pseudoclavibacter sp.]|nr:FAD-binding domain-containing protein [Pseudoclavibacter sp.]
MPPLPGLPLPQGPGTAACRAAGPGRHRAGGRGHGRADADEASNPVQWQWAAGCGADAAPYLRVFNPEVQRRTFDSSDHYVDRWLSLRNPRHMPRIVDLKESRRQAVNAYRSVGSQGER